MFFPKLAEGNSLEESVKQVRLGWVEKVWNGWFGWAGWAGGQGEAAEQTLRYRVWSNTRMFTGSIPHAARSDLDLRRNKSEHPGSRGLWPRTDGTHALRARSETQRSSGWHPDIGGRVEGSVAKPKKVLDRDKPPRRKEEKVFANTWTIGRGLIEDIPTKRRANRGVK